MQLLLQGTSSASGLWWLRCQRLNTPLAAPFPAEPNINHWWRKRCLQGEKGSKSQQMICCSAHPKSLVFSYRKAAGNLSILKREGEDNSRFDESWWQLLYTAEVGRARIIGAVLPLKVLKSLLLETPDLRQTVPRSAGSWWPLPIHRSQDREPRVGGGCWSAPRLSLPESLCLWPLNNTF